MIPFAPWLPAIASFETGASREALNVIPSPSGYRPFPAFANIASAITGPCLGAFSVRSLNGTIFNFCGDATKIYKLNSNGLAWTDVSRTAGGAYGTASDGFWSFARYGDFVIAANNVDTPQVFNMASATNFSNLGGSPPQAAFAGAIREFGVLAKTSTANNRIRWSAIGNVADWVASATTLSDYQDFADGGSIMGFVGGEYGIVLQEKAIQRMSFEGPPTAFRFDKISNYLGCRVEGSVASYENLIFFLSDDGFYMIRGGAELVPIGTEKIDRWLEANLDASYLYRITSAIDPVNKLYVMGFASFGSSGIADQILIYNWVSGQWSHAQVSHQLLYAAATQQTYTIDGMDAVSATIDGLPFPMDSRFWAGSGRLLLSAFDTSNRQGMFTGLAMAATIETGDIQLTPGRRSLFRALKPLIEGTSVTPSLTVGKRNNLSEPVIYNTATAANAYGVCDARVNGRYHRARITLPAASAWQIARGIDDVKFSSMGER